MTSNKLFTIYLVRGKNEKHAEARARSGCKPFKVKSFGQDDFHPFLFWYCLWAGRYFVYPIGADQESDDWIVEQIGKDLETDNENPQTEVD